MRFAFAPEIKPLVPLADISEGWNSEWRLIFCDEDAGVQILVAALAEDSSASLALLMVPKAPLARGTRDVAQAPERRADSLGPRILRADTAAVAASPSFKLTRSCKGRNFIRIAP